MDKWILSDEDWKARLSEEQYRVLRRKGTEAPFCSGLNPEQRDGTYHCAGCDLPLFSSAHKFFSKSGWPSFYHNLDGAVETETDTGFGMVRTEIHCARCDGHLGHVFEDGPPPTGLRYCVNGEALRFEPEAVALSF